MIVDDDPPASSRINDTQIGDIDGDGRPDIWTTGRGAGANAYQMVWYRNPSWERYPVAKGDYKYGNLGDFDSDGDLDIIVGRDDDSQVYWFENNGNPTQSDWPAHSLGLGGKPDLLAVGDINDDSRLDVVYMYKDEVGWAENQSNPKNEWSTHTIWSGSTRTGGTLADIDDDGDLDIIYGNAWFQNPLPSGDPTSGSEWTMRTIDSNWPTEARAAVGDLDDDGRLDIVLSGEESSHGVAWYRAPSDVESGSWSKHAVVSSGYEGVHSLSVDDFDGDGDLDIFAAEMHHFSDPDKVAVFENVDIANNEWQEHTLATFGSHNARVGDLNADGYPDIVGKNFEAGDTPLRVDLWWNQFRPGVDKWQRHTIDSARPWRGVFIDGGDVNGDDLPDIVTGGWWYENPGHPGGAWDRHTIGGDLNNMAVLHDLDRDGDLDILGTKGQGSNSNSQFVWAQNDGSATFDYDTTVPDGQGDFLQGARVAQIEPGGNPEIVLSWHNSTSTQMFNVPSPATDAWTWSKLSDTTNGEQIAIDDIDDDNDLDIHLGTQWLRNDGNSWAVIDAFSMGDSKADPDRVELADINNDGDLDVVIGAEHANRVVWGERPANPENGWTEHVITTEILGMSLDVGDLDFDGDIDVVVGEHDTSDGSNGRVFIYRNEGDGASWQSCEIDSGLEHHDGTQLIDIDKDGDLDILSVGWNHDEVVLYENLNGGSSDSGSGPGPGNKAPNVDVGVDAT